MHSFFIHLFLSTCFVNFTLIFVYDNYYLDYVHSAYMSETQLQLRELSLDIRSRMSQQESVTEADINLWATDLIFPIQVQSLHAPSMSSAAKGELLVSDYIIDFSHESGPMAYVNMNPEKVIAIGPADEFYIESTSYQPLFIVLFLMLNILLTTAFYRYHRKKTLPLAKAIDDIIAGKSVSNFELASIQEFNDVAKNIARLNHCVKELETTNSQFVLEQRDLMHAVAHELRSPLARFSFGLELIEDNVQSEQGHKLIKDMNDSVDELESLIRELLSYSRLSHGNVALKLESFDLVELVSQTVNRLQTLYPNTRFAICSEPSVLTIEADERLLERALTNLLRNAARFAKQQVKVTLEHNEQAITIHVDDDGIGIPPGKRDRIFEAFTRLDPSRSRDSGGVGLGLAIVKQVVEKHQGQIAVSDSSMSGARFSVVLPSDVK